MIEASKFGASSRPRNNSLRYIMAPLFGIMPRPSLRWPNRRNIPAGYDLSKSLAILPFPPRELIPV